MKRSYITIDEIPAVIGNISKGAFFGVVFRKKDGTLRHARAQRGVHNPANVPPPKGTGESGKTALSAGRLKFFDSTVTNADGSKGNYRQARFSSILEICYKKTLYIIDHTS